MRWNLPLAVGAASAALLLAAHAGASPTAPAIAAPDPGSASSPQNRPSLAPLVEGARPSVVGVTVVAAERRSLPEGVEEYWRRFFGDEAPPPGPPDPGRMGIGSGVIIDPSGIVLTNNHVVQGAGKVLVKTSDEQEHEARILGSDPETDIAVLQIEAEDLQAATLGSSDQIRVGDFVVAIGNPFGLELTVTSGIISAKARVIGATPFDDFLQTDAAINPGNSGGPLFDLDGRVVGINTAIVARAQGIGFAVPIDLIKSLLPQLRKNGRVVRGYLGVGVQDLTPELASALRVGQEKGALVASVEPGGPAADVDLAPGDAIVSLDSEPVGSASELSRRVAQLTPGTSVELEVLRDGKRRSVRIRLGERPHQGRSRPREEQEPEEGPMGLAIVPLPESTKRELELEAGAMVAQVEPGSRAAAAGIQVGDVIVEANRRPVRGPRDLVEAAKAIGDRPLALLVRRGPAALYVVIQSD